MNSNPDSLPPAFPQTVLCPSRPHTPEESEEEGLFLELPQRPPVATTLTVKRTLLLLVPGEGLGADLQWPRGPLWASLFHLHGLGKVAPDPKA